MGGRSSGEISRAVRHQTSGDVIIIVIVMMSMITQHDFTVDVMLITIAVIKFH